MLKNITLSAEDTMINIAREKARQEHTTLNSKFRQWLENYSNIGKSADDYDDFMEQLNYTGPDRKYSRDEMNER